MSSTTPHPIQPDPRQPDRRHPYATAAGHRSLPLPHLLNKSPLPQSDYQTPYDTQSLQIQPRHAAPHHGLLPPYPHVSAYPQPPQDSHTRAPGRLILPRLHSPSDSGSPYSPSYPVQNLPFGDHQVYQNQRYHAHQIPSPARYSMHPDSLTSTPSSGGFASPLLHLPLGRARQQNPQPKSLKMYVPMTIPLSFPANNLEAQNATTLASDNSRLLHAHVALASEIAALSTLHPLFNCPLPTMIPNLPLTLPDLSGRSMWFTAHFCRYPPMGHRMRRM